MILLMVYHQIIFKMGLRLLNVFISLLFSSMLVHGTAPAGLLLSILVPLIKNKRGNKCDSNNYHAIAISSLLGKLFDIIILFIYFHTRIWYKLNI